MREYLQTVDCTEPIMIARLKALAERAKARISRKFTCHVSMPRCYKTMAMSNLDNHGSHSSADSPVGEIDWNERRLAGEWQFALQCCMALRPP